MLRTTMTAILCGLCLATSGYAAVDIEEWSGAGSGFIIHDEKTIEITAAGTYYFQSYDGASPADIDSIYIAEEGVAGTDYDIADATGEITIYTANGNDYAFWAEDSGGGPGTGFIDDIILDDPGSMTGNFTLLIADPNYPNDPNKPGALRWNAGNLVYPAGTSTVINVHLAADLASDDAISCDSVSGTISVGGDLDGPGGPPIACDGWGRDFPGKRVELVE